MTNTTLDLLYVPHHFDKSVPEESALRLGLVLFSGWETSRRGVKITQLTEGTTNLLYKATYFHQTSPDNGGEKETVLIKVYGSGTEITIDRQKELKFHQILSDHKLAPKLLLRFDNGHAYHFVHGKVCSVQDIATESIWRGVARELARWHTILPVTRTGSNHHYHVNGSGLSSALFEARPNIWITAKKWLDAIPEESFTEEGLRKEDLEKDFRYLVQTLNGGDDWAASKLVFGHGDLLCANVVIEHSAKDKISLDGVPSVKFIDYEHSTYCPPAFELANHFSEWAGFECEYSLLPSKSTRRAFLREYIRSSKKFARASGAGMTPSSEYLVENEEVAISKLMADVDQYRGFPGFYWGLCALIQASTATDAITFDYAAYAKLRLSEYRAWREEVDGTRLKLGKKIPLREERWAAEN